MIKKIGNHKIKHQPNTKMLKQLIKKQKKVKLAKSLNQVNQLNLQTCHEFYKV
jgi:hypothetical protein